MEKDISRFVRHIIYNSLLILIVCIVILSVINGLLKILGFTPNDHIVYPPFLDRRYSNIEFDYFFKTNNMGLRYKNIPFKKPKNSFRVFVVGDSTVEGVGVSDNETFCSLLENKFTSQNQVVNFINGGKSGTGPQEYYRIFTGIGMLYHPDILLICLYANDLPDIHSNSYKINKPKRYTRRWSALFKSIQFFWPEIYNIGRDFKKHVVSRPKDSTDIITKTSNKALKNGISPERISGWIKTVPKELIKAANEGRFNEHNFTYGLLCPAHWSDALDVETESSKEKWTLMKDCLLGMIKTCRRQGIEVGIIFIPTSLQYDPLAYEYEKVNLWERTGVIIKKEWLTTTSEIQRRIKQLSDEEGVFFLDLTEVCRSAITEGKSLNYRLDGHWNKQGHNLAAAAIASWLREKIEVLF